MTVDPTQHAQDRLAALLNRHPKAPMSVHVWTIDEILALPSFGRAHGWFYALVEDDYTDDQGIQTDLFVLAEAYPGMGYTPVDREDPEGVFWPAVFYDLQNQRPARTRTRTKKNPR